MKRASYREAIRWMVANDDTEWANDRRTWEDPLCSVTAVLVADLFGKTTDEVTADIRRALFKAKRLQCQRPMSASQ